jgi:hypothetical protein
MIEFGNVIYYIDLKKIEEVISPTGANADDLITTTETTKVYNGDGEVISVTENVITSVRGKEMDISKLETIKLMLEIVLDTNEEELDTALGADRALEKMPLSYKIAFNTLLNYNIIREK